MFPYHYGQNECKMWWMDTKVSIRPYVSPSPEDGSLENRMSVETEIVDELLLLLWSDSNSHRGNDIVLDCLNWLR